MELRRRSKQQHTTTQHKHTSNNNIMNTSTSTQNLLQRKQQSERHETLRTISFVSAILGFIAFVPLLIYGVYPHFAYPVLIASSICVLTHVPPLPLLTSNTITSSEKTKNFYEKKKSFLQKFRHITKNTLDKLRGDLFMTSLCILIIVIPMWCYGVVQVMPYFPFTNIPSFFSNDFPHHKELAKIAGKFSVMSMSFFLIPVSRHSILLQALQLDPVHAITIHMIAGEVTFYSALGHGIYYTVIYFFIEQKRNLLKVMIPSTQECFNNNIINNDDDEYNIINTNDYDMTCVETTKNFLGCLSLLFLTILTVTSIPHIRRAYYWIFFYCHVIFGILLTFTLFMHFGKTVLYISPSLCYYLASVVPTFMEMRLDQKSRSTKHINSIHGVEIVSVKHISDSGNCVQVSVSTTNNHNLNTSSSSPSTQYGLSPLGLQHVKICVPSYSKLMWHPFTVYKPLNISSNNNSNRLNFIFRTYGPFTKSLSEKLKLDKNFDKNSNSDDDNISNDTKEEQKQNFPVMLMNGYHGGPNRIEQALSHQTVCIIAGGIGIVSYLDMLVILSQMTKNTTSPLKNVELHWVCRDEGLISHIVKHHFNLIGKDHQYGCDAVTQDDEEEGNLTSYNFNHNHNNSTDMEKIPIKIVIHHTGKNKETNKTESSEEKAPNTYLLADDENKESTSSLYHTNEHQQQDYKSQSSNTTITGKPFNPSLYSQGLSNDDNENNNNYYLIPTTNLFRCILISIIAFGSLYISIVFHERVQTSGKETLFYDRTYVIFALLAFSIYVSYFLLVLYKKILKKDRSPITQYDYDYISYCKKEEEISWTINNNNNNIANATNNIEIIHNRSGERPDLHQTLNDIMALDTTTTTTSPTSPSTFLGVFICGPVSMIKSVKESMLIDPTSKFCLLTKCAIYEEKFEI